MRFEQPTSQENKSLIPNLPPGFNNYTIEPVEEGVSTHVYRLTNNHETLYLRIKRYNEHVEAETYAYDLMQEAHIKVPTVEYVYDAPTKQESSYMIIDAQPGMSLQSKQVELSKEQKEKILFEAGQDLARINEISVHGYGYMHDTLINQKLVGQNKTYKEFLCPNFDQLIADLQLLSVFDENTLLKITSIWHEYQELLPTNPDNAVLNHGDIDLSHIYQNNGQYSGMIDFGDILGGSMYFDLAHIKFAEPESFNAIYKGYISQKQLPENALVQITFEALMFSLKKLKRRIQESRPNEIIKKRNRVLELLEEFEHL